MAEICGHHRLEVSNHNHLDFKHVGRRLKRLAVGTIAYGTDVKVNIENSQCLSSYSVSLPLKGLQKVRTSEHVIYSDESQGIIINPYQNQELDISGDCTKLQIAISALAMKRTLEQMVNKAVSEPIVFYQKMNAIDGPSSNWWKMIRLFVDGMDEGKSLYFCGQTDTEVEQLIIKGLLLSQPSNYSNLIDEQDSARVPFYLKTTLEYITDNLREDLDLEDIVNISGVARYRLFEDFKVHCGVSPMAYLKSRRLKAVKDAIEEGGSKGNISSIASFWGFRHFGRFSTDYKKAFDETPSDTLKRVKNKP
ncbi:hypothetical protein RSA46_19365 [Pseudomonas oryzihabitans]|nr:hypothetical protein RSA46_19365 [Pseudomonas psychrotolerans]